MVVASPRIANPSGGCQPQSCQVHCFPLLPVASRALSQWWLPAPLIPLVSHCFPRPAPVVMPMPKVTKSIVPHCLPLFPEPCPSGNTQAKSYQIHCLQLFPVVSVARAAVNEPHGIPTITAIIDGIAVHHLSSKIVAHSAEKPRAGTLLGHNDCKIWSGNMHFELEDSNCRC